MWAYQCLNIPEATCPAYGYDDGKWQFGELADCSVAVAASSDPSNAKVFYNRDYYETRTGERRS